MNRQQMKRAVLYVTEPQTMSVVSEQGEVLAEMPIQSGAPLSQYLSLVPEFATLEFGPDVRVYIPPSKVEVIKRTLTGWKTGANPDFKVTSASRNEREMKILVTGLKARVGTLDRKIAAVSNLAQTKKEAALEKEQQKVAEKEAQEAIEAKELKIAQEKEAANKEADEKDAA